MAQFIVRHLEDGVKARLKRRAERRSMEEKVRHILRNATKEENLRLRVTGAALSARALISHNTHTTIRKTGHPGQAGTVPPNF